MMTYFEIKERLANLEAFRELYRQYIGFTNREDNVPGISPVRLEAHLAVRAGRREDRRRQCDRSQHRGHPDHPRLE